jgi:hypothetical protein
MLHDTLIKGKGTGGSLFLAWSLGVVATFPVMLVVASTGSAFDVMWRGFIVSLLCLSVWQAILLLPIWRRRLLWVAVQLVALAPLINFNGLKDAVIGFWIALSALYRCSEAFLALGVDCDSW